jgi:hypothetical protein
VLAGSAVRYGAGNRPPALAASCTTPGLALSADSVRRGGLLRYSAVGPADGAIVVAIDAARLRPDLSAVPLPGAADTQVVKVPKRLTGCRTEGRLGVQMGAGTHTVSVFPAAGGDPLASRSLTVTAG